MGCGFMAIADIFEKTITGTGCTRDEALWLANECALDVLLKHTDAIRRHFFGNEIHVCAIVNARCGACSEDCAYCAQSSHHDATPKPYPLLKPEEILAAAKRFETSCAENFSIVTSGPCVSGAEFDAIAEAVALIRNQTSLKPCVSLGNISAAQVKTLVAAGLDRFHHNLETSESFFGRICTTHTFRERVEMLRRAKEAGAVVCAGGLFGMGETWGDRIDLALALREIGVDNVPVNFLVPVPGTPLENIEPLGADEGLRIVAVLRFLLPRATLRICGGRPTTLGAKQEKMFRAGANAFMTGDYLTTPGLSPDDDLRLLEKCGLSPALLRPRIVT
jgi:biotin synthase